MKLLQIIKNKARTNNLLLATNFRCTSTVVSTSNVKRDIKEQTEKPTKKPFVKNLFVGKFDTDILVFPEVLENDRLKELESKIEPIEHIFGKDESCNSREKLKESKEFGLFGLQIPQEYGGLNFNATEYTRSCEALSQDGPAAIALVAHQSYGLKVLLQAGNQQQKQKYLPRLASGEWVAAFCLAEPHSSIDPFGVDTEAKLIDGDKWCITGSKVIINGDGNADLMTVIAKTQKEEFGGKKIQTLTAFLVERTYDGVIFENSVDIVGDRGVSISEVRFKNTPVPKENILGEIGDGYKFCADTLSSNRYSVGSYSAGILRKLLEKVATHTVNNKQLGKNLMDFELIQKKIANIVFSIYTLESVSYLTAGILDSYENPDTTLESAIVKVLSSEMLCEGIQECQNVLGSFEFFKNQAYDTILRDSKVFMLLEGSNEVLRMFIALGGLQHAGNELKDSINKERNPAFHPTYALKKLFERRSHHYDTPKLTLGLDGYVHPTLGKSAKELEYGVLRLKYIVEVMLARHGRSIVEKEISLNRITDIVIGLYTMTAVLARASRSYCTGIQHSEFEVNVAVAICSNIVETIKDRVKNLENEPFDGVYTKVAKEVYGHKGYFFEHPLSRNIF